MPRAAADAIVIVGPTACGKTELAIEMAEGVGGEIISADSRQVYRYLDIGTAKPSTDQRRRVPHHGLDIIEPDEPYSAGRFARDAWSWIDAIRGRGRVPIVCGGTGFFVRALLSPLAPEPAVLPERRAALRSYLATQGVPRLKRWLGRLDPERAEELETEGGPQRLVRSLEIALASGRPHSWWLGQPPETPALTAVVVCLEMRRELLYRRIDNRLDDMVAAGLVEEVRDLLVRFPRDAPGLRSVGYAEIIAHVLDGVPREDAVAQAKRSTRQFARRQLTWFRHQLPGDSVKLDAKCPRAQLADQVARLWVQGSGDSGSAGAPGIASSD